MLMPSTYLTVPQLDEWPRHIYIYLTGYNACGNKSHELSLTAPKACKKRRSLTYYLCRWMKQSQHRDLHRETTIEGSMPRTLIRIT